MSSISFNEIPRNLRAPFMYVEFDNTKAVRGPAQMPYTHLIIGQKLPTGTAPAKTRLDATSAAQARTLFGPGSMLAAMAEKHFANNTTTKTVFIALDDDNAGNKAAGSITIGGSVSAGTLVLYIGGRRLTSGASASDSLANVASKLNAAINAQTDLPVTAAINGDDDKQIDLTARHKGETGNDIDIRFNYHAGERLPDGLTATIAAMTGGSGNPDLSDLWAILGDTHYHVITHPYTNAANLLSLETELASRWGPLRMIEAVAITAASGSHSALTTLGNSRNSPHSSIMHTHGSPTPPWEWAAAVGATASFYGNIDQARPFQTLILTGILPPAEEQVFTIQEEGLLLFDGISTFRVTAGGNVAISRLITTYQVNAFGAEDISYLDLNTPLTLGFLRFDFRNYILRKYPRHKLRDDGRTVPENQAIITPKVGRAEGIARAKVWERLGLVENIDQFKDEIRCERNAGDPNRLDWYLPPDLVNQFRIGAAQIGFIL